MNFYKHTKQKLKYLWWMFIYSDELGVRGLRIKYNFYSHTPIIIPYKYILRFVASEIAYIRTIYGEDNLLLKTSTHWDSIKDKINISPISKQLLNHLFYKLQFNDSYILSHMCLDNYYKKLYEQKINEIEKLSQSD